MVTQNGVQTRKQRSRTWDRMGQAYPDHRSSPPPFYTNLQTSNDGTKIYDIVYDIVYDVVYDIVYDVTQFIQPAARLLHQRTLLPSDGASKFQLLYALILERAPAAFLLHP